MNNIPHPSENMELAYENEIRLAKEFEKIELVARKIEEKYNEYDELKEFVEYLKGMEKLFARAKIYNWTDHKIKEEIIGNEIKFFSSDSGLDEDLFETIRDDFGMTYYNIHQIYEIAEKLVRKYSACDDCKEFIEYMKKVSIVFIEIEKDAWSQSKIKSKLYNFRMRRLSADGNPEPELLEKIKMEFEESLSM